MVINWDGYNYGHHYNFSQAKAGRIARAKSARLNRVLLCGLGWHCRFWTKGSEVQVQILSPRPFFRFCSLKDDVERLSIRWVKTYAIDRTVQKHHSQQLRDTPAGGVAMALDVCLDRSLNSWILSFGPFARVVSPASLARDIAEQIEEARALYEHSQS